MRFSAVVFGAFVAVASAQSTTPAPTTSISPSQASADSSASAAQASIVACVTSCAADDVNCKAKCVPVRTGDL